MLAVAADCQMLIGPMLLRVTSNSDDHQHFTCGFFPQIYWSQEQPVQNRQLPEQWRHTYCEWLRGWKGLLLGSGDGEYCGTVKTHWLWASQRVKRVHLGSGDGEYCGARKMCWLWVSQRMDKSTSGIWWWWVLWNSEDTLVVSISEGEKGTSGIWWRWVLWSKEDVLAMSDSE